MQHLIKGSKIGNQNQKVSEQSKVGPLYYNNKTAQLTT